MSRARLFTVRVWLQVALGDSNELLDADYEANNLPAGKHSTKGLGRTGPHPQTSVNLSVPLTPPSQPMQLSLSLSLPLLHQRYRDFLNGFCKEKKLLKNTENNNYNIQ